MTKAMNKDRLILHRFMSREEYIMYQSGEVLHNDTILLCRTRPKS